MESVRDLSNLSIAHEITVNPDFRIEPSNLPQGRYINSGYLFISLLHNIFVDYNFTYTVQPDLLLKCVVYGRQLKMQCTRLSGTSWSLS